MSDRRFNPASKGKLDNPERRKALPPEKILSQLEINKTDAVLDLGAGTGYFTFPAADLTDAPVYALDIEPEMLAEIQSKMTEQQKNRIKLIEGSAEQVPLEDELVERVIASMILHEIEPLSAGLREIYRLLKPGGRCLVLEWEKKETDHGPPFSHRIHSSELKEAFEKNGFKVPQLTYPTEAHYILIAEK